MTNEEIDRLTKLRPSIAAERAELEATMVKLRAREGGAAQFAEALSAALRAWDDGITGVTVGYVRDIANLQSMRN